MYQIKLCHRKYVYYLLDSNMRPNRSKVQPVQIAKSTRQKNIFAIENI